MRVDGSCGMRRNEDGECGRVSGAGRRENMRIRIKF